ncbi:MAG: isoprenylcysteine carboxylmethyltransferase family protein [Ferrovibrio sp.]|uniref:methyltransferase family protein n=1 Tax=Ferrovibrio sp. TaxID=1917215 RepID=UPI002602F9A1|nr:isoprenylcysteine carboxylmethyltransferase family protein [Ferrovibrio sp.]MCW0234838.1 isoprenylcysteine carboxylmethyltransferase family protein [Ferrovibrio sp.]
MTITIPALTLAAPADDTLGQVQRRRKRVILAIAVLAFTVLLFTRSMWPASLHEACEYAGYGLIFICIAGRTWCALYIGGRKKTLLVDEGPYSISRNPLYLFSILGGVGVGLQAGNLATGLALGLFVFAVFSVVIAQEEAFLKSRFPSEFAAYAARVPRWGPRLSGWRSAAEVLVQPRFVFTTFRDALWFVAAIPVMESIELAQKTGWLPELLRLP